jgi:hypothetical protein
MEFYKSHTCRYMARNSGARNVPQKPQPYCADDDIALGILHVATVALEMNRKNHHLTALMTISL